MPAVHPDPAVFADPLRAAADVGMASRDDEFDVVGIAAFDPILGSAVPYRVLGRELGVGRDFNRANRVVRSDAVGGARKTPVADVAVMADPVHQLTAAEIVVP